MEGETLSSRINVGTAGPRLGRALALQPTNLHAVAAGSEKFACDVVGEEQTQAGWADAFRREHQ